MLAAIAGVLGGVGLRTQVLLGIRLRYLTDDGETSGGSSVCSDDCVGFALSGHTRAISGVPLLCRGSQRLALGAFTRPKLRTEVHVRHFLLDKGFVTNARGRLMIITHN